MFLFVYIYVRSYNDSTRPPAITLQQLFYFSMLLPRPIARSTFLFKFIFICSSNFNFHFVLSTAIIMEVHFIHVNWGLYIVHAYVSYVMGKFLKIASLSSRFILSAIADYRKLINCNVGPKFHFPPTSVIRLGTFKET